MNGTVTRCGVYDDLNGNTSRQCDAVPLHIFLWMWSRRVLHELNTDAEKVENRVQCLPLRTWTAML